MIKTIDLTGDNRVNQGEDYKFRLRLSSNTIDFTGATAACSVKKKASDPTPFFSFVATPGSDITGVFIDFFLAEEVSNALVLYSQSNFEKKSSFYSYDVYVTPLGGRAIRVIEGTLEISPADTK